MLAAALHVDFTDSSKLRAFPTRTGETGEKRDQCHVKLLIENSTALKTQHAERTL